MPSSVVIRNNSSAINKFYGTVSHNSSEISVYRSAKSGLYKKYIDNISAHPDIYGQPEDSCAWCAGSGCGHCPPPK